MSCFFLASKENKNIPSSVHIWHDSRLVSHLLTDFSQSDRVAGDVSVSLKLISGLESFHIEMNTTTE